MTSRHYFTLLLCSFLFYTGQLFSQHSIISSVHTLEPAINHYAKFKILNSDKNPAFSELDDIAFPPELYSTGAILYAMAKPVYLTSDQVAFLKKSVNFPANSSEQTKTELDFLMDLQRNRSAEQTERVLELASIGYWPNTNYISSHNRFDENLKALFYECQEVIGNHCTANTYPATSKLLQGVMNDMRLMEFAVKFHHLRARPYQLETDLKPLREINSPSFASGHTLWAYIQAFTFSELIPSKREEFVDLAYEIGFSRELMGVHYPSDEEVARQLAHRMLLLMWNSEKFQGDFIKAKMEWLK